MDFYTHLLSGAAVATVTAAFSKKSPIQKSATVAAGMFGGIMPDLDTITLWPNFDVTVGKWFGMKERGMEIYLDNHWYSHHHFFHSLAGVFLISLVMTGVLAFFFLPVHKKFSFSDFFAAHWIFPVTMILGGWIHLIGDIPTPPSSSGGIKLLWPSDQSFGGFGIVWWSHNYDLLLILFVCCLLNVLLILKMRSPVPVRGIVALMIFSMCLTVVVHQISVRDFRFNPKRGAEYVDCENHALKFQRRLFGDRIFSSMFYIERKIAFWKVPYPQLLK